MTATLIIPSCYWWRDRETEEWIVIPGCLARAMDPHACSCGVPPSRIERERAKRRAAEQIAQRLADKITGLRHEREIARMMTMHWIGVLRAHGIDPSQHNEGKP